MRYPAVLCDLDGVIWLAHHPISGSVDAVAALRRSGRRVLFVTNNSAATLAEHEAALAGIGISAVDDVVSSAVAAATLIDPGERVLVSGGPGVVEAVQRRGAIVVDDGPADAVIVGFHRSFDFAGMHRAASAVRNGARLIATNDDPTYPTPDGPLPGGGAIAAAIATAAEVAAVVAGKPHEPMASVVAGALGWSRGELSRVLVVGDRPSTDGAFAATLGAAFALVRTGVTTDAGSLPGAAIVADDLSEVASMVVRAL
jgi:HAD superfamily hydrolase (TIGR01450 family)